MPDQKVSQFTADTTPTDDDLVMVINDPAGTPGSRKTTIAQLRSQIVNNDSVAYGKIQNVSATDRYLGRFSSGSGDIEEGVITDLAQSLLDDTTQSDMQTTLGLVPGVNVAEQSAVEPAAFIDDTTFKLYEEFMNPGTVTASGSSTMGSLGWALAPSGTGAQSTAIASSVSGKSSGVRAIETGTTNTGFAAIHLGANPISGTPLFIFEWMFCLPILSTVSEHFSVAIGLHTQIIAGSGGVPGTGAYIRYSHDDNSGEFESCTADAGSITSKDTGVAAVAGTWYKCKAVCDGAATPTISFYLVEYGQAYGSAKTTHNGGTDQMPDAGVDNHGPVALIEKEAGNLSRQLYLDSFKLYMEPVR